jgi:hypothetical protein
MVDEDLLVTNAFYPIAVLTDNGAQQSVRVDYKYGMPNNVMPYEAEQMGPYPQVSLTKDKKYDAQTARDFKTYLRKKNPALEHPSMHTNAGFMDTVMERGNMPVFHDKAPETRGLKIRKITINIDSRARDKELYPNASSYVIQLPFKIQNIKYVEMISSEIPINTTTTTFPYMFVCSKFLADIEKYDTVDNIFAKIQLNPTTATTVFNGHLQNHSITTYVDTPLDQLSALDFELKNPDNTYYEVSNGGGGNEGGGADHSFTLVFTVYIDVINNSFISSRRGIQDKTNLDANLIV